MQAETFVLGAGNRWEAGQNGETLRSSSTGILSIGELVEKCDGTWEVLIALRREYLWFKRHERKTAKMG